MLNTEEEVDKATDVDVRTACKLLLNERSVWLRRTEMHETRCEGLQEMLGEMVDLVRGILVKQKNELERLARISSEAVTAIAHRRDELEEL